MLDPQKQQLLQDSIQTGKETKQIREQFQGISETFLQLQKQTNALSESLKHLSTHQLPHSSIGSAIGNLSEGYSQQQKLLSDVSTKIGFDLVKDLDRFQKQWKLVITSTKQYTKTTFKHKVKEAISGNGDSTLNQSTRKLTQQEKTRGLLERQMITDLNELYDISEDAVFMNVFWHAKSLEIWSNIYEKMASLEKPSADKEVPNKTQTLSGVNSDMSDVDEAPQRS